MSLSASHGQIDVIFSRRFRLSYVPRGISRAVGGGQGLRVFFKLFYCLCPLAEVAAERQCCMRRSLE